MKSKTILFFVRSAKYARAMRSVVRALAARGFAVRAVYDPGEDDDASRRIFSELQRAVPHFSAERGKRRQHFKRCARALRGIATYRSFVRVEGRRSFYARHWRKFLPRAAHTLLFLPGAHAFLASRAFGVVLARAEARLPHDPRIDAHIKAINPSVVVVAYRGQPPAAADADYLSAAKYLGIPTAVITASWDTLTTKGMLMVVPDRLLVWNERQKRDALRYHSLLSPERVHTVGAFQFDDWFARSLPPSPPEKGILYIASSAVSGDTIGVAEGLRTAMDKDEVLRGIPLFIRPPLETASRWRTLRKGIILLPPSYAGLSSEDSTNLFLDALARSFVAVGVHTTGLIDAAIKGLPVIIYSPPAFRAVQDVPHFQELLQSGAAEQAETLADFVRRARALWEGIDERRGAREAFVASLRPRGVAYPAASAVADEIEILAKGEHSPRIIFACRTPKQFYNIQSIAEALVARDVSVRAYFDEQLSRFESRAPLQEFAENTPGFSFGFVAGRLGIARWIIFSAREILSYRSFLTARAQSSHWARRWYRNIPLLARACMPFLSTHALRSVEEKTPPCPHLVALLKKEKPDAVVVTPTNMHPQSMELEMLKAAKALHITTFLPVFTWDNLTTKGLLHIAPDILLAWNEKQAREAEVYHGIPRERIGIVGALPFDRWFTPSEPAGRVEGFRPCPQKTILYVGASAVTAADETWLVRALAAEMRRSPDARVRAARLLFRPHPFNRTAALALARDARGTIEVLERESRMPNTPARFKELQREILEADIVCGVSTSAMVDAVVADTPVVAVAPPEYRATQEGAEHWRMLAESGAARVAASARDAVAAFATILLGNDRERDARAAFVAHAIRPLGREVSAGERAAELITARALARFSPL